MLRLRIAKPAVAAVLAVWVGACAPAQPGVEAMSDQAVEDQLRSFIWPETDDVAALVNNAHQRLVVECMEALGWAYDGPLSRCVSP
ncbi:MAG: hypothetical protein AB1Z57_05280 [Acidimicrobiia bacterium]